jgi:hypothetical protein
LKAGAGSGGGSCDQAAEADTQTNNAKKGIRVFMAAD